MILPQALRIAIPPTVGFLVQLVKNTSLASAIGFVELTRAGQIDQRRHLPALRRLPDCVAALYFALCFPLTQWSRSSNGGSMSLVEIADVDKRFGTLKVLDGVSLSVERGRDRRRSSAAAGSGKSTLLRCINGLEPVQGGQIVVDGDRGQRPEDRPAQLRQHVGIVFQSYNLFPHLTVERNITLAPTRGQGATPAEAREIAREVLREVGLEDKIDAYPDQLSGGQQQRVAIARSLAMQPHDHAVRRDHLGARPGADRRGAARCSRHRARRHDDAAGDP